jgi:tRNA 2-selenouridine synthase
MTKTDISPELAIERILSGQPFLDVRAPIEFSQGSFPNTTNIPILNDEERKQVGTCYKNQGNTAAVQLGEALISGSRKTTLLAEWTAAVQQYPDITLFCFRGGQRSGISQRWLADAGYPRPKVTGGYKAIRQHLLQHLEHITGTEQLVIIGGKTGVRKTTLIEQCPTGIDLEKHANHRGSAFGEQVNPQPAQIDFEHQLILNLLAMARNQPQQRFFFEDEGNNIGRIAIPLALRNALLKAPIWVIEDTVESRAIEICRAYIIEPAIAFQQKFGNTDGIKMHRKRLSDALYKIQKRLGSEKYNQLNQELENALQKTHAEGNVFSTTSSTAFDEHLNWITPLLTDYYDPMYDYQLSKKQARIAFHGNWQAVLAKTQTKKNNALN